MRPAIVYCAALAISALGGAPVQGAVPLEVAVLWLEPVGSTRDAAVRRMMNDGRLDSAVAREGKALIYDLGTARTPNPSSRSSDPVGAMLGSDIRKGSGTGSAVASGAEWSPRIGSWSDRSARMMLNFDRRRFNGQALPLRMLGQRFVLSHLTVGRNRVHIMLSTGF